MILVDLLDEKRKSTWAVAKRCGVKHAVVRLPESEFDVTSWTDVKGFYDKFQTEGLTPIAVEPMPNHLHEHIKRGDERRDECIDKVCKMLPNLARLNINLICFNWMAYIGWLRTTNDIPARGNSKVTGFSLDDFNGETPEITAKQLWKNYEYFLKAVLPYAEKYGVTLALHPDDPPLPALGKTERIMISYENIQKALTLVPSPRLGVTFCQATYRMMGEDLYEIVPKLKDKIFFVHFRNAVGNKFDFHETFHDEGELDMAKLLRLYHDLGIHVPVRVDHVPTYPDETAEIEGYGDLGRYFAIGYLKGLLDAIQS